MAAAVDCSSNRHGFGFDPANNAHIPLAESIQRSQRETAHDAHDALQRTGLRFPRRATC